MEQPEANAPSAAAAAAPEDPAANNADAASAPSSPTPSDDMMSRRKKEARKKRKVVPPGSEMDDDASRGSSSKQPKTKKPKRKDTKKDDKKKPAKNRATRAMIPSAPQLTEHMSAAQLAVNEQMRRALEEDKYSAVGSIVDTDSDEDDADYPVYGGTMHIDRTTIMNAMKKRLWMAGDEQEDEDEERRAKKKRKKAKRTREEGTGGAVAATAAATPAAGAKPDRVSPVVKSYTDHQPEEDHDHIRDGGSIFGQTAGASNATWVECDKCKKWRRLRGVVDEKKLPSKWYCSMNKNDPERARCSAPEEEYDTQKIPENAADARTRKHLRILVRRLQANEAYESRQPTMTRGKKRSAAVSSKDPYEWVRCCNPSCGKWRAVLRIMDAKTHVIDRTTDGEWYCVMNTWDEKTASCAAPQENLPAIGCPPWVMQDDN